MLANLSVDQVIFKAKIHLKKGEIKELQKLYQDFLEVYPQNIRIQRELNNLKNLHQNNFKSYVFQKELDHFINLYNQDEFITLIKEAKALLERFPSEFIIWNILGVSLNMSGKIDEAIDAFKKAIYINPSYADAYFNLGNTLKDQNKPNSALEAYQKTLSLDPNYIKAYNMMGNTLQDLGKFDDAIDAYQNALLLNSKNADAYSNMGNALQSKGSLVDAIDAFKKAIVLNPNNWHTYINMGNALQEQGMYNQAIKNYNASLSINPNCADTYFNMGVCLQKARYLEKAIKVYRKALSLQPHYPEIYINMGNALLDLGNPDKAIEAYENAISFRPEYPEAYSNKGKALNDLGQQEAAIEAFNKAICLNPNYADAYCNKGVTLQQQGKLNEAINLFEKSISLKPNYPDPHQNLSFALLNSGKIREGLNEYEWRKKNTKFLTSERQFPQPYWDGKKELKGKKILLWSEQGIGDTLNWSSSLPYIRLIAEKCILECQEKLVPLLKRSFPDIEIRPVKSDSDKLRNDFDYHLPMGSIYKHFIDYILKSPKPKSYLVPDPDRVNFWKQKLFDIGKGPYVGISWKSSVVSPYRLKHYPPLVEWYPILTIPDITFVNLQYSDFKNDLNKIEDDFGVKVHNFSEIDLYKEIDDVAALCKALDMVVSTKVTPAILSSGVGTPTKIANLRQSDWNNILFNPVSSAVDIFERNIWEPWDDVFHSIAEEIIKIK